MPSLLRHAAVALAAVALAAILTATAVAGAALAAGAPATASAATTRHCGDIHINDWADVPLDVRAKHTSCYRARTLAQHHYFNSEQGQVCDLDKPSCRLDGFTCRRTSFGDSGTRVKCRAGDRRVRFVYGV